MIKQHGLTLLATVRPSQQEALDAYLKDNRARFTEIFQQVPTLHYARWVILQEGLVEGEKLPPKLILSLNFDGPPHDTIAHMAKAMGNTFDAVYQYCEGKPADGAAPKLREQYLQSLDVGVDCLYVGAIGRTVNQVKDEARLRDAIKAYITGQNFTGKSAKAVHQQVKQHILGQEEFKWASQKATLPKVNWPGLVLFGLCMLPVLPLLLLLIIVIRIFKESKDKALPLQPNQLSGNRLSKLKTYEDMIAENQFSQLVPMKPGGLRRFTYNFTMWATRTLHKLLFVEGELMGIPTIHFARWVLVEQNKRMVFFSNFDGSWEQYLGDFIDKSGWGLNGILSNAIWFPKTAFLFFKGAYDEFKFLAWARYTQIPTQVWYCAYPGLTIKNVNNNSHIRNSLSSNLSEKQAQAFLHNVH